MFYKMGGINYFLYLKSRKTFSSMGLVPSKMAKMPKSGVFGAQRNVPDGVGRVYDHQKILFLKFGQFAIWGTHLPNYEFWGAPRSPTTLFCGKTSLEKIDFWEQNIAIKGMKLQLKV